MNRKRFVYISHCRDIEFFDPVKEGMNDAAALLDVEVSFIGTDDIDVDEQKALLQKAIADGVDGIATTVTHETAFDDLIGEALDHHIPVVCFNTDASGGRGRQLSTLVQDTYAAGVRLGNFMAERMESSAKALITLHSDGIDCLESRKKGIMDGLAEKEIEWEFLTTGNGSEEARKRVTRFLEAHSDIRFVFGTGQDDTVGSGQAIMDLELGGTVTVCGFDISPVTKELIRQGHILATVDQQPYMQGFYPVLQLYHYLENGIQPSDMDAGSNIITKAKL
ncbi:MAG: substrate-binding domain-containing protein [Verrucomicrobiota bacterium]